MPIQPIRQKALNVTRVRNDSNLDLFAVDLEQIHELTQTKKLFRIDFGFERIEFEVQTWIDELLRKRRNEPDWIPIRTRTRKN